MCANYLHSPLSLHSSNFSFESLEEFIVEKSEKFGRRQNENEKGQFSFHENIGNSLFQYT